MPLLTVTNLLTSPINFQDPTGLSGFSLTVPGSGTVTDKVLTMDALEAIESQLVAAAAASQITWQVSDDPASVADDIPDRIQTVLVSPHNTAAGAEFLFTNLTIAGAVSVVLAAAAKIGQRIEVVDGKGDAGTNNVTITVAGGGTINGGANLVLSTNGQKAILVKVGATSWVGHRVAV
jgi:hypothetical protein